MKVAKDFRIKQIMEFPCKRDNERLDYYVYEAQLIEFKEISDFLFTIHNSNRESKLFPRDNNWVVSEFSTGMQVATSEKRKDVIRISKEKLIKNKEGFPDIIKRAIQQLKDGGYKYPVNKIAK